MEIYSGGCACGQVRFELADKPTWVIACHCDECKKRTGSDYGVSVMTASANVAKFDGETKTYTRKGDSGSDVHYEFCPQCGTTVRWKVAYLSGKEALAAGAFDDISALGIAGEMYTDFKAPWVDLDQAHTCSQAPDDTIRHAWIEKSISS